MKLTNILEKLWRPGFYYSLLSNTLLYDLSNTLSSAPHPKAANTAGLKTCKVHSTSACFQKG